MSFLEAPLGMVLDATMTSDVSLAVSQSIVGCLDNVKLDLTRALSNFKEKLKEVMFNILSKTGTDRSWPAEDFGNCNHNALVLISMGHTSKKYSMLYIMCTTTRIIIRIKINSEKIKRNAF